MSTLRHIVPALCLATSLSGLAVYAATTTPAADAAAGQPTQGQHWHHGHHGRGMGGMGFVLHKLNLTADQKAQVKAIFAGEKSQFEALHTSGKTNHAALATTPPNDPSYPALIETEQHNAATRISLMHQTWKQVYETVLTKAQRDSIPGIVAAAQAERTSRMAAWKAQHAPASAD
jgi:Spy/CpxP family protein refolding chaperone